MVGSIIKFFIYGFIWLFIFSIHVNRTEKLFDLCYDSIVDSQTVHELKSYLSTFIKKIKNEIEESPK